MGSREDKVIEVQKGLHAEALSYLSISLENVITVKIDDFDNESMPYLFEVKVPAPAAFIFHKGLVFHRRKDRNKKAKDLYYIFDVLVNFSDSDDDIYNEFKLLKNRYRPWFDTFVSNMEKYFSDMTSEGIQLVSEQRPVTSFPRLTDDQFKFYAFGIFQGLIKKIKE